MRQPRAFCLHLKLLDATIRVHAKNVLTPMPNKKHTQQQNITGAVGRVYGWIFHVEAEVGGHFCAASAPF